MLLLRFLPLFYCDMLLIASYKKSPNAMLVFYLRIELEDSLDKAYSPLS